MLIIKALQNRKALFYGMSVMLIALFWPAIPLRGLDVWFKTLARLFPTNIGYLPLVVLMGFYTTLFVYRRQKAELCRLNGGRKGIVASFVGVFLGACPACIPAIAFFLPLSATITLSYFSWIFLLFAILLLTFLIFRMGAFQRA